MDSIEEYQAGWDDPRKDTGFGLVPIKAEGEPNPWWVQEQAEKAIEKYVWQVIKTNWILTYALRWADPKDWRD
jgi:hypothetical protein